MDKPASGTPEEFGKLLDTAEAKGLVVQLGYMYRYNPAVQKCLELLDAGKLGEIYSINAEMSAFDPPRYKTWLSQFPGGGMYIFGCHLLDLIVRMLGKPEKVHSFAKHTGLDGVDLPDFSMAVLEYPKALARVNGWGRRQLMVSGSKGTVNIVPLESPCRMFYSDTELATHHHEDHQIRLDVTDIAKDCRYDEMMQCFYAYITGEKENPYSYAHDRLVQQLLWQIVGGQV